jgi:all-trans-retinol 13,14-reductase
MNMEKRAVRRKKAGNAIVIGAGFSGMVSALLLARSGIRVTLLERSDQVAPLLRNYFREGFEINHGFHYLGGYYPGGALRRCFEELDIAGKLDPINVNNDGFDVFSGFGAERIVMPVGPDRVRSTLESRFPASMPALEKYFALLDGVFRDFSFFSIESFFYRGTPDLTGVSLHDFLAQHNAEKKLIDFLGAYTQMLLGLSARESSLLSHLLGVGAYFYSAQTFRGGGGALVAALEERLRRAGVDVRTGCEAVRVLSEERRHFTGVAVRSLSDGAEFILEADACISTIHPKRLLPLIQDRHACHLFARRIGDYSDTQAVCVFHLAVAQHAAAKFDRNWHIYRSWPDGRPKHHLTLLPDFSGNHCASPQERQMTVLMSPWDNEDHPDCPERLDGHCCSAQLLEVGGNSPVQVAYLKRVSEEMTLRLESEFPELKEKYRIIDTVTPCHFDRLNATWDGSIYGVRCSVNRFGISTIGPLRGFFLAGQSVTAPGIFGALVSAYLACNRITGNINL